MCVLPDLQFGQVMQHMCNAISISLSQKSILLSGPKPAQNLLETHSLAGLKLVCMQICNGISRRTGTT